MRVSEFRIVEARLAAENRLANDRLEAQGNAAAFANIQEALQLRYKQVRHLLTQWEEAHKHRAAPALGQAADLSENLRASAAKKLAEAKERFIETRQHWRSLVERDVAELQRLLLPASAAQTAAY